MAPPPGKTGDLTAYQPSWREQIGYGIANLLGSFGMTPYGANDLGKRTASVLDFTPVGVATGANDLYRAASAGNMGNMQQAMLGMVPGVGKVGGEVEQAVSKGIRAFHGSPHSFDQFDLSKIGTGEGAQAYGHGLYFAENEGVAKSYRDALRTHGTQFSVDGRPIDPLQPEGLSDEEKGAVARLYELGAKDADQGAEILSRRLKFVEPGSYQHDRMTADLAQIEAMRGRITSGDAGSMYEVNINAEPNTFLDWDAQLHQQPASVQQSLAKLGVSPPAEVSDIGLRGIVNRAVRMNGGDTDPNSISLLINNDQNLYNAAERHARMNGVDVDNDMNWATPGDYVTEKANDYLKGRSLTGEDIQRRLGDRPAAASKMREAGIPGIKYLDAGSRGGAEGSRNYVVFDDKLVQIVKKYGLAGAVASGLISQQVAEQMRAQGIEG